MGGFWKCVNLRKAGLSLIKEIFKFVCIVCQLWNPKISEISHVGDFWKCVNLRKAGLSLIKEIFKFVCLEGRKLKHFLVSGGLESLCYATLKITSAHTSLPYIHTCILLTLLTFFALPILKKKYKFIRYVFSLVWFLVLILIRAILEQSI